MDEQQRKLAEELLFSSTAKRGFGKGLYLGMIDGEKVFPFPKVSSSQSASLALFLERVETFAKQQIDGTSIDRKAALSDQLTR
jgi:hypothetical protein